MNTQSITFTISAKPIPASRPRIAGKGRFYPKRQTEYRKIVRAAIEPHIPAEPINETVSIEAEFVFPRYKTSSAVSYRADLSNLIKDVEDMIVQCGIIQDDYLITESRLSKRWAQAGEEPHTTVSIRTIQE